MATDDLKCAPNRILINTKGFDTVIKKGTIMYNPHITVMAKSTVTLIFIALTLSSCADITKTADSINHAHAQSESHQASAVQYECDSGDKLSVEYINSEQTRSAKLIYKNRTFDMYETRAASGSKYATEQGITPEYGLIWWTQKNDGTLIKMLKDHTIKAKFYPVIESCAQI
jgi:membrane-bound inhibitor of C-type lysozyme